MSPGVQEDESEGPSAPRWRRKAPWFGLAALCVVADLWSKTAIFYPHVLEPGFHHGMEVGRVTSWWRTILVYNQGITFGMFHGVGAWVKVLFTAGVIVFLTRMLWTSPSGARLRAFALSIVIGGAVGNLYDRTLRPVIEPDGNPGVRDFLDWYAPKDTALGRWLIEHDWNNHWYTSNVADVLIVCGVILLAWCILREPDEESGDADSSPETGGDPTS